MADLYSNTDDGYILSDRPATWAGARDDTDGDSVSTSDTRKSQFTEATRFGSRGGGNTYQIRRSFMYFDTSGITSTLSSATIKIYGYGGNDGSVIAVKSTAFGGDGGTALATTDLDAITGYSAGSSLAGAATVYGAQILTSSWSTSSYNEMTGSSDLLADMKNNNVVIICFMNYTNDYLNSAVASDTTLNCGGYYTDNSGTSKDPYIEYAVSTGPVMAKVNGVTDGNIAKVDGVTNANMAKIIGITDTD